MGEASSTATAQFMSPSLKPAAAPADTLGDHLGEHRWTCTGGRNQSSYKNCHTHSGAARTNTNQHLLGQSIHEHMGSRLKYHHISGSYSGQHAFVGCFIAFVGYFQVLTTILIKSDAKLL